MSVGRCGDFRPVAQMIVWMIPMELFVSLAAVHRLQVSWNTVPFAEDDYAGQSTEPVTTLLACLRLGQVNRPD